MKNQFFIGDVAEIKDDVAKTIVEDRSKGRLLTYSLSIVFGLTFSLYPLLNNPTVLHTSIFFEDVVYIIQYAIPIELPILMLTAIISNRCRVVGFKLFPVWVDPHIKEGHIIGKPDQTFQTMYADDTIGAMKLAFQEVTPISLTIMLPGSFTFIERGFVEHIPFFIAIGLITLIFATMSLYFTFNYKVQELEIIKKKKIKSIKSQIDNIYKESDLMKVYNILLDEAI